jgi:signal transduction histidine kinase
VSEFQRAGLDVRLTSAGQTDHLTAAMRLALYRIAEEALANVARHVPRARVTVSLTVDVRDGARLRVLDDGGGDAETEPATHLAGSGLGVTGMRERAALLQGTLTAGPFGDGWCVECVLPPASAARLPDLV